MKKDFMILAVLVVFNLALAFYSFGGFVVEDAAIHAEISSLILHNGPFITSYQPVSNTLLTYPPLFHYLAALLGLFLPIILSVRILGAIAFALIPVSAYFASKTLTKKPIIPAIASVAMANLSYILVFAAFPQLMALNLYLWFLYFFFKDKKILAGVFAGLTILTHPFTGFFTMFTLLVFLIVYKKSSLKTILPAFAISLFWAKQYLLILLNMFSNSWNNSRWVAAQGFHFEPLQSLLNVVFFRLNIIVFILAMAGFVLFLNSSKIEHKKRVVFSFVFALPLIFTIYHVGVAQYKFLDILSVPLILFCGTIFSIKNQKISFFVKKWKKPLIGLGIIIIVSSLYLPITNVHNFVYDKEKKYSAFDQKYLDAALWLGQNRKDFSRVVLLDESSIEKPPKSFNSELVFSQLANKYPLDGTISDLEKYSEEYRQQLEDRKLIIQGDYALLEKYDVKYLVGDCKGKIIYKDSNTQICETA